MPSTYTVNLGLEKPATGEQAGVWGTTANTSYDAIDAATDGSFAVSMSSSGYNLITNQGAPSVGRNKVIVFSGPLTADGTVTIDPNTAQKIYFVKNGTSGGFNLIFRAKSSTGSSFTLANGRSAMIYADGLGSIGSVFGVLDDLQVHSLIVQTSLAVQGQLQTSGAVTFASPATFQAAATFQAGATISAPIALNLGGDAPYDIYYRNSAGQLAFLHVGSPGQVLGVTGGGGLGWTTPASLAVGGPITGSIANAIYFANATPVLAQDANILARASVGIGLGVLPTHTLHLGYGLQPEVWLDTNAPASQIRQLVWATNAQQRWVATATQTAETGGNAGSNWTLLAYNDAVSTARVLIYGTRATGNFSVGFGADGGARVGVFNDIAGQPALLVRGASGQTDYLQTWQNSSSVRVASIDNSGNLFLAAGLSMSGSLSVGSLSSGSTVTASSYVIAGTAFQCGGVNGFGPTSGGTVTVGNVGGGSVTMTFRGGILTNVAYA